MIEASDWRALCLRPLVFLGDKSFAGNSHFRLSRDARTCTLRVYGHAVTLYLLEMRGKVGQLLRVVATLTAEGENNVEFSLSADCPSVVFDLQDLRRLPAGAGPAGGRREAGGLGAHALRVSLVVKLSNTIPLLLFSLMSPTVVYNRLKLTSSSHTFTAFMGGLPWECGRAELG